jgi:hypothetical protein
MGKNRLNSNSIFLMAVGAVLGAIMLLSIAYIRGGGPAESESRARLKILKLIPRIRIGLASATESEKNAAVAETDQASKNFADQAHAATSSVEHDIGELAALVAGFGTDSEKELFSGFSRVFAEFKQIEDGLLDLFGKNTNVKAYDLAFGPVVQVIEDQNGALNRLVAANTGTSNATAVAMQALKVQVGVLRIQALLAPHIAEADDGKMDRLETAMSAHDREVRDNLERLGGIGRIRDRPALEAAMAGYEKFTAIRKDVLALSRQNTNVRSLAILMNRKLKVDNMCQETLEKLQQSFQKQQSHNPRAL